MAVQNSLHTDAFSRVAIGVRPAEAHEMLGIPHISKAVACMDPTERHFLNMFTEEQDRLIQKVADKLARKVVLSVSEELGSHSKETNRL
jgi:peptidyl-tRNA hydrolase